MIALIVVIATVYILAAPSTIEGVFDEATPLDTTQKMALVGFYLFGKVSLVVVMWMLFVNERKR